MKSDVGRHTWGVIFAVIILAGCNGSPSQATPVAPAQTATHAAPGAVPAHTEARKTGPLLYVSDQGDNFLYVFSLPAGKLVQKITGFLEIAGVCSDTQGHVFVVDYQAASIKEYLHGGKEPIAVLNDPDASPIGCSVDPTTGNLAVTNETTESASGYVEPGDVAIYPNAKGTPKDYADQSMAYVVFDSYDGAANLYISGVATSYQYSDFAVLHKGRGKVQGIRLNQRFSPYAALQWDGQYLAVASESDNRIYRFKINGTEATKVGRTKLVGASSLSDFWIQNHELYAPMRSDEQSMVGLYRYPRGGHPTKTLLGFAAAFSATVSSLPNAL